MLQVLRLLEHSQSMSVAQLVALHPSKITERSIQRYIREFHEVYGLELSVGGRGRLQLPGQGYVEALARFLKIYLSESVYPPVHGEVSEKLLVEGLKSQQRPAQVFCEILRALRDSRVLHYAYRPQHADTRRRLAKRKARTGRITRAGYMPVAMIPYGFSFGGELMLLVGEAIFSETDAPNSRAYRQYALRGILDPRCGQIENRQLECDFSALYADSIYTWLGGTRYELTIEDARFDEQPRVYVLRANGEEEALQFVSSALGRIKIINPPPPLVVKAKELGLLTETLFRFSR